MNTLRHVLFSILFCLGAAFSAAAAEWDFRDLYMSVGLNSVLYDIRFPKEVRDYMRQSNLAAVRNLAAYAHSEVKPSLLLDIRMDLRFQELYRLVPVVHFWNWGDFPESETGTETSIRGFGVNVEVQRLLTHSTGIRPYAGGGVTMMVLRSLSRFDQSFWPDNQPLDISRMESQIITLGAAAAFGLEFPMKNGTNLMTEFRYEVASDIKQLKFLVGISTF